MTEKTIKIGTRGSKLAIYQAEQIKSAIEKAVPKLTAEIIIIKTKGDIILDVPLEKIGDKGLFTKELEVALLNRKIDMAVHSLKDLPTTLPEKIILGGVLQRGEVRDVLITKAGKKLNELTTKDKIATSSLRRKAQLLAVNNDFQIIDIRGNVDTRLKKLEEGYCDALVLAGAGVIRLGLQDKITEFLSPDIMFPAISQGIIGFEIRENDSFISTISKQITHAETLITAKAERSFLKNLEGGCHTPIGCYTSINEDSFKIIGFISDVNGKTVIKKELVGHISDAEETATKLAQLMLDFGGGKILKEIKNN